MLNKVINTLAVGCLTLALSAAPNANAAYDDAYNSAASSDNTTSVQSVLNQLGLYKSALDGVMDEEVRDAIKSFQSSIGLNPSGVLDINTADALNEAGLKSAPLQQKRVATAGHSDNIKSIQQILKQLGYISFEPNGVADDRTREAIKAFQMNFTLNVSGLVDPATASVLNSEYNKSIAKSN